MTTTYNLQANHIPYFTVKTYYKITYYIFIFTLKQPTGIYKISLQKPTEKLQQIQRPHGHLIVEVDSSTGHSLILGFDWQQS